MKKNLFFEKQIYDLKQLLEISKSLNSTMDLPSLIEAFLYACMGQLQAIGAALFTKPDFDAPFFEINQNLYGFDTNLYGFGSNNDGKEYRIPENHALIAFLTKSTECVTIEKILESGIAVDSTVSDFKSLEPTLIVPLKTRGRLNGILMLGGRIEKKPYSNYEKEHVMTMASLAAIAINNAMLLDMSTTDIMTRLKLRHFFYATLSEKMEQCMARGCALSVIMLDIDFFKRFNDTHGHSCGDFVLQKVAEVIQKNTRAQDLSARYGGEEFVIMLFETDINIAQKIAERIRNMVKGMDMVYDGKRLAVTISAGVTQYNPDVDNSAKALVDRADKALYASKAGGRDMVTALPSS